MFETQKTIATWADVTFGPATNLQVAKRAQKEMDELISCLEKNDNDSHAAEEIIDIYITLCRVLDRLGIVHELEVQRKMAINRARKWVRDGRGTGQHVEEKSTRCMSDPNLCNHPYCEWPRCTEPTLR